MVGGCRRVDAGDAVAGPGRHGSGRRAVPDHAASPGMTDGVASPAGFDRMPSQSLRTRTAGAAASPNPKSASLYESCTKPP